MIAVEDHQGGVDSASFTTTELLRRTHPDAELRWGGQVPIRLARHMESRGADLVPLLRRCEGDSSSGTSTSTSTSNNNAVAR